jgi:hypothetical protein
MKAPALRPGYLDGEIAYLLWHYISVDHFYISADVAPHRSLYEKKRGGGLENNKTAMGIDRSCTIISGCVRLATIPMTDGEMDNTIRKDFIFMLSLFVFELFFVW